VITLIGNLTFLSGVTTGIEDLNCGSTGFTILQSVGGTSAGCDSATRACFADSVIRRTSAFKAAIFANSGRVSGLVEGHAALPAPNSGQSALAAAGIPSATTSRAAARMQPPGGRSQLST